jgi:hypothetical protein
MGYIERYCTRGMPRVHRHGLDLPGQLQSSSGGELGEGWSLPRGTLSQFLNNMWTYCFGYLGEDRGSRDCHCASQPARRGAEAPTISIACLRPLYRQESKAIDSWLEPPALFASKTRRALKFAASRSRCTASMSIVTLESSYV